MTPAAAYYRMSDDEQVGSIPSQQSVVRPYASENSYKLIAEYADHGISGDATDRRKEFQRMHADALAGKFKAILCWDQDRFGRFDSIEAGFWIHPLRKAGVKLVTVADGVVDWDTFTGRVMYSLKQEGKHQFLCDHSRNVARELLRMAQDGQWPGGPAPLGYDIGPDRRLALGAPDEIAIVRLIFDGYLAGKSLRDLTEELNEKGYRAARGKPFRILAISYMLKNRNYTGDFHWNTTTESKYLQIKGGKVEAGGNADGERRQHKRADWVVIPDSHPALVTREEFAAVQEIFQSRRPSTPLKRGGLYVLSGLLRCAACGSAMTGSTYNGEPHYVCGGFYTFGKSYCSRNSVKQGELLSLVVDAIEASYLTPGTMRAAKAELKRLAAGEATATNASTGQLAAVRRDLDVAERNMALASTDALRKRYERIVEELADREQSLQSHQSRGDSFAAAKAALDDAIGRLQAVRATLDSGDPVAIRNALRGAIERIEVKVRKEKYTAKRFRYVLDGGTIEMNRLTCLEREATANRFIEFKRAS